MIETDLCIMLAYPNGASGKFLINCLSMNKEFCPLVRYQDLKQFNTELDQQNFLINKLKLFIDEYPNNFEWRDLDMGEWHFTQHAIIKYVDVYCNKNYFDIQNHEYHLNHLINMYYELVLNAILTSESYRFVKGNSTYFFRTTHHKLQHDFWTKVFKTKTSIEIINCQEWVKRRNANQNAIIKYTENVNYVNVDCDFKFNGDSFLARDSFTDEYLRLLNHFDFPKKNIDKVLEFYDLYVPYILGTTENSK